MRHPLLDRAVAACVVLLPTLLPGSAAAQDPPWRSAERVAAIPREELDAITARGRLIAGYDFAAWHATDAVRALRPRDGLVQAYLARPKLDGPWEVVFGRLNARADTFFIAFRVMQTAVGSTAFTTYEMRPPAADTGYFALAARALEVCRRDFGPVQRPYNSMVVPVGSQEEWYVYFLPAPTVAGIWPHGGDIRYRVSADGRRIVERRPMHIAILEASVPVQRDSARLEAAFHTALLDDRPEDTDVFHVLTRQPRVKEIVVSRSYYFAIDVTGRIMAYDRDTTIKRDRP